MAGLEDKILENTYFQYLFGSNSFCIWTEGFEKLEDFYQYLNSFHPTIKFTMEFSKEQINFLDVKITEKGTDTHHLKSYPCYVYKKGILYG